MFFCWLVDRNQLDYSMNSFQHTFFSITFNSIKSIGKLADLAAFIQEDFPVITVYHAEEDTKFVFQMINVERTILAEVNIDLDKVAVLDDEDAVYIRAEGPTKNTFTFDSSVFCSLILSRTPAEISEFIIRGSTKNSNIEFVMNGPSFKQTTLTPCMRDSDFLELDDPNSSCASFYMIREEFAKYLSFVDDCGIKFVQLNGNSIMDDKILFASAKSSHLISEVKVQVFGGVVQRKLETLCYSTKNLKRFVNFGKTFWSYQAFIELQSRFPVKCHYNLEDKISLSLFVAPVFDEEN